MPEGACHGDPVGFPGCPSGRFAATMAHPDRGGLWWRNDFASAFSPPGEAATFRPSSTAAATAGRSGLGGMGLSGAAWGAWLPGVDRPGLGGPPTSRSRISHGLPLRVPGSRRPPPRFSDARRRTIRACGARDAPRSSPQSLNPTWEERAGHEISGDQGQDSSSGWCCQGGSTGCMYGLSTTLGLPVACQAELDRHLSFSVHLCSRSAETPQMWNGPGDQAMARIVEQSLRRSVIV